MKFEVEGKIGYRVPDDPTGEYYSITTDGGRNINVGFNANQWGGNIHDGIPNLRSKQQKAHSFRGGMNALILPTENLIC